MASTVVNGIDAFKTMSIDHCVMVQCATNAKSHYDMLKSEVKRKSIRVVVLERELKEAKDDLEHYKVELQSQKTTVCVLQTLCNHEDVIVLKGEDAMKKDVIDLCSCDDDWNNIDEFDYNGSVVNGVNTNKKEINKESNHITPDKGRKRCKK